MSRKYKDIKKLVTRNGRVVENSRIRNGLKIVHIGADVWRVGKVGSVADPTGRTRVGRDCATREPVLVAHQVIYGPDNKEYHMYGNDVYLTSREYAPLYEEFDRDQYKSYVNRHGNISNESALKIYILTSILDKRENWCFDLKQKPHTGKLKVICHNGTVKNIEFDGEFSNIEIESKHYIDEKLLASNRTYTKTVVPVGFRIC